MGAGLFVSALVMLVLAAGVIVLVTVTVPKSAQDAVGVRAVGAVALAVATIVAVAALWQSVTSFIPGSPVTMDVPIQPMPIALLPGVSVETATRLDAGAYTTASVTSSAFSAAVRIPGGIGTLLVGVVPVMIGIVIWIVCRRLLAGAPFARSVSRISLTTAVVTLVAGLVGQVLLSIAASAASTELFDVGAVEMPASSTNPELATGYPSSALAIEMNLWPVAVAFILVVFATIVQFGARIQQNRDDLRAETVELRHDTEGLI